MNISQPATNLQSITFSRRTDNIGHDTTPRVSQPTASASSPKTATRTLNETLKRSGQVARASGEDLTTQFDDPRKERARQQISQIRETIRMLKRLIMLFGGKASKSLLRQLKQLARALAEAASVLKESGVGGSSSAGTSEGFIYSETSATHSASAKDTAQASTDDEASIADAESEEMQAAHELVAETESELASLKSERSSAEGEEENEKVDAGNEQAAVAFSSASRNVGAERRADAELIEKALQELKALVALAKAARPKDSEADKQLKDINEQLVKTEEAIQALNMSSLATPASVGISVQV